MRTVVGSIESEYRRYKGLADRAIAQLEDDQLARTDDPAGNSVAVIVRHLAGNFRSRFTDFLMTDGEKPWRDRDSEFVAPDTDRAALLRDWEHGWSVLFATLAELDDDHLGRTVTIRGVPLTVLEALHRSLSHAAYHVGQIVLLARGMRGAEWRSLSIPRGGTAAYNANPTMEKPPGA